MRTVNLSISIGLILCGASLWLGLSRNLSGVVSFAVIGGWIAIVGANSVFAITLILCIIRAPSGQALALLKRSALSIINFVSALVAIWFLFSSNGT